MKAWVNGKIIPHEQATVPILSHSLGRGSAIFEVLDLVSTAKGPAIFRADLHTERLFRSAECMHMQMPLSHAELIDAMKQIARANGLVRGGIKVFAYWPQVEFGLIPKNPKVDIAIFAFDFGSAFGLTWDDWTRPISAGIVSVRKLKPNTVSVHAKTAGNYVNSYQAKWEAVRNGYDDGILLDDAGNVAEGPVSSLFLVKDGTVRTSRLDGVLAGVTRDSAIQVTRDLGIALLETDIPAMDLATVEEAFYTGTHIRVKPITSIDKRSLGACPGPVTARIQKALQDAYDGCNPRYSRWLDYV